MRSLLHSAQNYFFLKKLKNLSQNESHRTEITKGDILFVENPDIRSTKTLQQMSNIVNCIFCKESPKRQESFPFPVLHDTRSGYPDSSSVKWGTATLPSKGAVADIRPAMFVIEQTGLVEWDGNKPKPVDNPELFLTQLISGS